MPSIKVTKEWMCKTCVNVIGFPLTRPRFANSTWQQYIHVITSRTSQLYKYNAIRTFSHLYNFVRFIQAIRYTAMLRIFSDINTISSFGRFIPNSRACFLLNEAICHRLKFCWFASGGAMSNVHQKSRLDHVGEICADRGCFR
jgi:hypothetical protein